MGVEARKRRGTYLDTFDSHTSTVTTHVPRKPAPDRRSSRPNGVSGEISPCASLRFPLLLTSDENRDTGFGDGGGDGLTALVMDTRSGVGPACLVLREIGLPFGYTRLSDRTDEVFGAKHIFGALP